MYHKNDTKQQAKAIYSYDQMQKEEEEDFDYAAQMIEMPSDEGSVGKEQGSSSSIDSMKTHVIEQSEFVKQLKG